MFHRDDRTSEQPSDGDLVQRVIGGERGAFADLMKRYSRQLFRTARAVVRQDDEAEDIVQHTYLMAYVALPRFENRSSLGTWLTRIVLHEAYKRKKRGQRYESMEASSERSEAEMQTVSPESEAARAEIRALLERCIDALSDAQRVVFVLRDVEELTTREVAECLDMTEEAVRVRLTRARHALRDEISAHAGTQLRDVFSFQGERCARIAALVMRRLESLR